ncbi:sigma-70 family RNA polymerase sigma factor [Tumebacillus flagellatus]|uniref:RNA polymerase sigma factor SigS n=1 Tax=Tumebacillus flagellatus TaxID=1157490 RepID=A0A074MBK2_9BACL|nr:sigma-70 family RNA polymerase sigma factor [Tumebacillus flagellatus]KEO83307.1 hypothetical protein EL26_10035 [Tumebacillus flagellatus]
MIDRWTPIVLQAQAQDPIATQQLIEEFTNLIHSAVASFRPQRDLRADLVQESYLGFLRAIHSYDPTLGFSFAAHAKSQTRAAVWHFLRVKKRTRLREEICFDDIAPPALSADFSRLEWREMLATLSDREALAVERLFKDGCSMSELARLEGVHPDTARTWKKRALQKLKAQLCRS